MANTADWSKYIILTGDIDFEGAELTPVAPDTDSSATGFQGTPFKGVFDGQGFILRNAVINKPGLDYIGIFGQINGYACQIRNLNVENIQTIGRFYVGCLVGYNEYGSVTNCSSTGESVGNMNIGGLIGMNNGAVHSCHSRVVIGGEFNMGGLIGHNYFGSIGHCYSKGEIITGLYGRSIGGLVGLNQGDIFYSYAANPLRGVFDNAGGLVGENSGSIAGSYSSGNVEGRHYAGGLVGLNSSGSIGSSY